MCDTYQQFSFISGAIETAADKKYLKINTVGKIISYQSIEKVEVEYADTNVHQKEIIKNEKGYNLGDINEKAFVLAYSGQEINEDDYKDEENLDIYKAFLLFRSTDSDNDWSLEFNQDLVIKQVVLSNQFLSIATEDDEMKIFNYGGTEIFNYSAPGEIISICAFEHLITVVYSIGLPVNGR